MSQTANDQVAADGWGVWGAISALVLATVLAVVTFVLTSDGEGTIQAAGDEVTGSHGLRHRGLFPVVCSQS